MVDSLFIVKPTSPNPSVRSVRPAVFSSKELAEDFSTVCRVFLWDVEIIEASDRTEPFDFPTSTRPTTRNKIDTFWSRAWGRRSTVDVYDAQDDMRNAGIR